MRFVLVANLLLALLCTDCSALPSAPPAPTAPILRVETGSHTGRIRSLGTDVKGRWLVTASQDKTLRVWEIPPITAGRKGSFSLLRTIRPPIGEGNEGELYSAAISPDGATIACGGLTYFNNGQFGQNEEGMAIYFFDRATGALIGRITGLPESIASLAYSPDGRWLVAGLSRENGIRVYSLGDTGLPRQSGMDPDYGHDAWSLHFSRDGRLVTTSLDGYIRLYDLSGATVGSPETLIHPVVKVKAPAGTVPVMARFSPDATKIAVGYKVEITDGGTNSIAILSGRDLSLLYFPIASYEQKDLQIGAYESVAWSADGQTLYGGGYVLADNFNGDFKLPIRSWSDSGRGAYHDTLTADDTVFDFAPLADGRVAYSASGPALGLLERTGAVSLYTSKSIPNFAGLANKLLLSEDGNSVGFAYERLGKSPAYFDLAGRTLVQESAPTLKPPPLGTFPAMAKVRTRFKVYSEAIDQNFTSFVVGTNTSLMRYDSLGRTVWERRTPGVVWAVNVTANGKIVVAAYSDGSIHWHRMSDGDELAALFLHADRKRWVLWIPEGYFDASPDAVDLIGYHLNQGKNKEARFISIKEMYDVFYRPDIVQSKIRGEDITSLITLTAEQALKEPPPVVAFTTSPKETAGQAKVCYQINSAGGGIGEVRLFQNGKLIKSDGFYREAAARSDGSKMQLGGNNSRAIYDDMRGLVLRNKADAGIISAKPKGDRIEECVDVETVPGENEIAIAAFNRTNTVQSSLYSITFTSNRTAEEPHLYILALGADHYQKEDVNLKFAVKDAKDFAQKLAPKETTLYKPQNIHVTVLRDAGKGKILSELEKLTHQVKQGDGFIMFVASHGVLLQNQYFIVTSDYNGDLDSRALISSNEIIEMSKRIKSLSQLFIFDTCHAGGIDNIVSGLYDARMSVMAKKMGLHIYASAGSVQSAMDGYQGNGLYTYTLLQGIENGKDVDKDKSGKVTVKNLGLYSKEKTSEISTKLGHPQTPLIINFGRDNALFAVQ